jgi:endonuclease/exonuclease/phosphatase (EEP) superfamily protein YafD
VVAGCAGIAAAKAEQQLQPGQLDLQRRVLVVLVRWYLCVVVLVRWYLCVWGYRRCRGLLTHRIIVAPPAKRPATVLCVVTATWLLAGLWAVWAVVRLLGIEYGWVPVCALAYTPYAALTAPLPVGLALAAGSWGAAAVATGALVALGAAVLPRAFGRPETGDGLVLRVLTANLLHGRVDTEVLFAMVQRVDPDVLALQEYTPVQDKELRAAGLEELLPHRVTEPVEGGRGCALYSRFPLRSASIRPNPGGYANASATVDVPGFGTLAMDSVHPASPYAPHQVQHWRTGLARQPRATPDGPVRLLVGDFNATLDHAALRDLLRSGYRDAAAVIGRGLVPTWPFAVYGPLPRITLDHVLADRRVRIRTVAAHPLPGGDHRALYAELLLPLADPAAG